MVYPIFIYAVTAYAGLFIAGAMSGSVHAVLLGAASAFAAYVFQVLYEVEDYPGPLQLPLWALAIIFGIASGVVSLIGGF